MAKTLRALVYVGIGIAFAFPLFAITYYAMARTSTPEFCASCHEIRPAYDAWKTSTHVNNASGFVADCMDCHLPAPEKTFRFFYAKAADGIKDVFVHFFGEEYDREKVRQAAIASFENERCTGCHGNILHIPEKRGAMLAHKTVLYPRNGYEKKCLECHENLVHNRTGVYRYGQYSRR